MSKKEKLPKLYTREFINPVKDGGTAFIEVDASVTEGYGEYKAERNIEGHVKLADCNRMITLEFYAYTEKAREKRLEKLDIIIKRLTELRSFLNENRVVTLPRKKKKESSKTTLEPPLIN